MTYFQKHGTQYSVTAKAAVDLHEKLPVGTYTVGYDQMSGQFFLEEIESFEIVGKVYGDTQQNSDRILSTFRDRKGSTGVMLCGEKGSGKTLLAKMLSIDAGHMGIPTVVINQPWCGESFNGFMQMIEQPLVVVFDEFEKVYDRDDQDKMLTLLDGVYPSEKLFIITSNDRYRINEHMRNRPGRIYYRLDYEGLNREFVMEYCQDNLVNQDHIDGVCRFSMMFNSFNFDILKALVEEMNRYGEDAAKAIKMLNAKPDNDEEGHFAVEFIMGDKRVNVFQEKWRGNPLRENGFVIHYETGKTDEDGDPELESYKFTPSDLSKLDPNSGEFLFIKDDNRLRLTKITVPPYDYTILM